MPRFHAAAAQGEKTVVVYRRPGLIRSLQHPAKNPHSVGERHAKTLGLSK